jgi:hypothetical protein
MGEAKRRKMTEMQRTWVGAKEHALAGSARQVDIIAPEREMDIGELEDIARAFLADDPEPFLSASEFVWFECPDGVGPCVSFTLDFDQHALLECHSKRIKVHPDPRVQAVLETYREAPMLDALTRLRATIEAATGPIAPGDISSRDIEEVPRWPR